ncbi:MAG: hypothetical protein A2677_00450 [Candidatus Komeilibacteria bacterium RIFCSPHIGHO2_01_FULL_52_14]|uniref:Phosphatidate cytidylyltransferase n=1 Tax=Candidatus Komeilibacteria bacterium RIFCSPHIGHO2_01_FULL_52_14 TaxID=1798549 RepID=A0A1G2BLU4_9BACT|nr:MAG: hypothetical protein A2677_00450 [Candidatus Komeilibacteria bacterium RIFCSPHIGHO2_01_FULL_52_14]
MSFFNIAIVGIGLLIFYFGLEFLHNRFGLESWLTRKIAHIASALVAIPVLFFLTYQEYLTVLVFFIAFFILATSKKLLKSIHLEERKTYGEVFFPFGIFFIALVAYSNHFVAVTSLLILSISDAFAGIVGRYVAINRKTALGSITFFFLTVLLLAVAYMLYGVAFTALHIVYLLFISVAATFVERISPYGSDNVTVPVAVAFLLLLLF